MQIAGKLPVMNCPAGPPNRAADFFIGQGFTALGACPGANGNQDDAGNNVGYSGVTVHSPEGKMIGRIRLPEVCANVTFGGPKRNRLFMAAGQSLYAVHVNTQGAGPG